MSRTHELRLLEADADVAVELPPMAGRPAVAHIFAQEDIDAVNAAIVTKRPLLLRGEPGIGKSQLARAVAQRTGRAFVSKVIDARTEPGDLGYRYDAVRRLGVAQVLGRADGGDVSVLAEANFIEPGPLWWAFDWATAAAQFVASHACPELAHDDLLGQRWSPAGFDPKRDGVVLLIDEMDKADPSVPNGLLEALGSARFSVSGYPKTIQQTGPNPLVVITTNEERTLPGAFLRRCWVREIAPGDEIETWLRARGRAHFKPREIHDDVLIEAVRQLSADRAALKARRLAPPGQAELIDLLRALVHLGKAERVKGEPLKKVQLRLLRRIGRFALQKHPKPREAR